MIAVSSKSNNFYRLTGYLMRGSNRRDTSRVAWTATRNLPTDNPDIAAHLMTATADLSKRCKKPVYHLILSWDKHDKVTPHNMMNVADATLDRLGLSTHEAVMVAHQDRDHPHIHMMVNRIAAETTKANPLSRDYAAIREVLRSKELEFGFRQTPSRKDKSKAPSRAELAIAAREGREVGRRMCKEDCLKLKDKLKTSFERAHSWKDLESRLTLRRYDLVTAGGGIRIMRDGRYAKLSDCLPPKLTAKKLHNRLGGFKTYKQKKREKALEQERFLQRAHEAERNR